MSEDSKKEFIERLDKLIDDATKLKKFITEYQNGDEFPFDKDELGGPIKMEISDAFGDMVQLVANMIILTLSTRPEEVFHACKMANFYKRKIIFDLDLAMGPKWEMFLEYTENNQDVLWEEAVSWASMVVDVKGLPETIPPIEIRKLIKYDGYYVDEYGDALKEYLLEKIGKGSAKEGG